MIGEPGQNPFYKDQERKRSEQAQLGLQLRVPKGVSDEGSAALIAGRNEARLEDHGHQQYFLHAEICDRGYERLSEYIKKQSAKARRDADGMHLFLDGTPTMKPLDLTIGKNVREMSQRDLDLEFSAVKQYNPRARMALNHPIPDLS